MPTNLMVGEDTSATNRPRAAKVTESGILITTLRGKATTEGDTTIGAYGTGDGFSASVPFMAVQSVTLGYNDSTVDRWRNNTEGTLLASAARTATASTSDQTNYNARGVRVYINATAVTLTPSVTFSIEEKDSVSGTYTAILTSAAVTTTGHTVLTVYPGATAAANVTASHPLPRTWRVTATHADTDSITYSVGYSLIL